jgi:tetratricopeptide (TPR) repeat protein
MTLGRPAIVSGKSEFLFFRQPGATERYELNLLLYPGTSGRSSSDVEGYELKLTFNSGQLGKPAESQVSSSQISVPISHERLAQAAELMAACLEEFISGSCPTNRSEGKYCDYVRGFTERGDEKVYAKDTEGAMADYAAALQYDPRSAVAHAARGWAYAQLKNWTLAASDYSEAIKNDPDNIDYYEKHANAVDALGDIAATITDYTQLIRLDPNKASRYRQRARAFLGKGDADSSVSDLTTALKLDGDDVEAYFLRARALDSKHEYQFAVDDFGKVIRIELDQLRKADAQSRVPLKNGLRNGLSDEYLSRSRSQLKEGVGAAYLARASMYLKLGEYDRAGLDYSDYVKLSPNSAVGLFARGLTKFYVGAFAKALADLSKAKELDPSQEYVGLWIMVAAARANKAGNMGERPAGIDTTAWPGPIYRMLVGEISSGELIRLAEDADPKKKKNQTCEATFFNGELALTKGRDTDAQALFETALTICPDDFNEWAGAQAELGHVSARRR